jgi:hypothetical protein
MTLLLLKILFATLSMATWIPIAAAIIHNTDKNPIQILIPSLCAAIWMYL